MEGGRGALPFMDQMTKETDVAESWGKSNKHFRESYHSVNAHFTLKLVLIRGADPKMIYQESFRYDVNLEFKE